MRDIRQDLTERLGLLDARAKRLQAEIEETQLLRDQLERLLVQEERVWASAHQRRAVDSSNGNQPSSSSALGTVLLGALREQPWTLEELKALVQAREIPLGGGAPGRIINFSLVGMQRHGIVQKLSDGRWALKVREGSGDPSVHRTAS